MTEGSSMQVSILFLILRTPAINPISFRLLCLKVPGVLSLVEYCLELRELALNSLSKAVDYFEKPPSGMQAGLEVLISSDTILVKSSFSTIS